MKPENEARARWCEACGGQADHNADSTYCIQTQRDALIQERDLFKQAVERCNKLHDASLRDEVARLRGALEKIAYEPIGHSEASPRDILEAITNMARAALGEGGGK